MHADGGPILRNEDDENAKQLFSVIHHGLVQIGGDTSERVANELRSSDSRWEQVFAMLDKHM